MGMAKGVRASLPLWLAPTQVRLIPVNEGHVKLAMNYAKKLTRGKVRSDVDDRGETDLMASSSQPATEHLVPLLIFPR
jgi:threonyl-tRNA synthetase